jgi:tetratricopeptide (TPR) repeat protein
MKLRNALFALLLVPGLAYAQPKTSEEWYAEGESKYNLGDFDKAIEAFKQGFEVEIKPNKKAAFLFNIAQAYRQANQCKDAAFFYKRYVALRDQDTANPLEPDKRTEIEQRIAELESCIKDQQTIASKPPTNMMSPRGKPKPGGTVRGPEVANDEEGVDEPEEDDKQEDSSAHEITPHVVTARLSGGAAVLNAGDLDIGVAATFALTAAYPAVVKNELQVDVGLALTFVPINYKAGGTNHTASFTSAFANGAASYELVPKFKVRGDLGVGAMFLGGVTTMGNPFTADGAPATGALAMFAVRFAASGDYAITKNLIATVTPFAVSMSPARSDMAMEIKSLTRFDFMIGIGYQK